MRRFQQSLPLQSSDKILKGLSAYPYSKARGVLVCRSSVMLLRRGANHFQKRCRPSSTPKNLVTRYGLYYWRLRATGSNAYYFVCFSCVSVRKMKSGVSRQSNGFGSPCSSWTLSLGESWHMICYTFSLCPCNHFQTAHSTASLRLTFIL